MGSPITFSGFNNIDFNTILNAVMQQERRPLDSLEQRKRALQAASTNYSTLSTKLSSLQSAASSLGSTSTVVGFAATSNNEQAIQVSSTAAAAEGRYDVVVSQLARAQVTVSGVAAADSDTAIVAMGGSITIDGVAVAITGPTTLSELAAAINELDGLDVNASVSETAPGSFRLILTAAETGAANAFTISNSLTGSTINFTDTDGDLVSGDTAADNAVQATNAALTINSVAVTATTNVLTSAIEGVTLTLLKADADETVVVEVARDDGSLKDRLKSFVTAYNDLRTLTTTPPSTTNPVGRDLVLRGIQNELRMALTAEYGTGDYTRLASVGLGFSRTGELMLDESQLEEALQSNPDAVKSLFADATTGSFAAVDKLIKTYTSADGQLPDARLRLNDEISRIGQRIASMEERLALRRATLQKEYAAADAAMSRLNSQSGTLANLGASLSSSGL
ncbi:MAG: flagellar filament capping protein FliD [Acidobacteria bacterium]|nr:flagellar filament capping protein FliD [Acidobacteriota bacterium]